MRSILCIDLKCFYAYAECIERNLDPYTTPLIVASDQKGSITLAISPYLKHKGIKSRSRIYELPKDIKYIIAKPKMSMYVEKSKEVINVFLKFIAKEDLHVYSIDEAFLDVTDYLKLYNKTDYELALEILKEIKQETKLAAACGIGPNLFMSKVSLDNEAKNNINNIAKWTEKDIVNKLWKISPLSKMWGIGTQYEKQLNNLNIYTVKDLAQADINLLIDKLGVIGSELWHHANGIDESIIKEGTSLVKSPSISNSQILFKNYNDENIKIIIKEMLIGLTKRLRSGNYLCKTVTLSIGYSREIKSSFNKQITLDNETNDINILYENIIYLYVKFTDTTYPIRKVSINLSKLIKNNFNQLSLFCNKDEVIKNKNLNNEIDKLHKKYGKNSIFPLSALCSDSTLLERNNKLGGHSK